MAAAALRFDEFDTDIPAISRAASRLDPYWGRLWVPGSQAVWQTGLGYTNSRSPLESTGEKSPRPRPAEPGEHVDITSWLGHPTKRGTRLAALSALDSWRTITSEQVCAITGSKEFATVNSRNFVGRLFQAGLIDIGSFPRPFGSSPARLYRPAPTNVFEQRLAPHLTGPEAIAVHGDYGWSAGHQYDRHNLLATELGLRVAEFTGMTVLGEKYASVDLLTGVGLGKPAVRAGGKTGDAVIVRDDGLRIVVEITASYSAGLEAKMERWAKVLHDNPMETSGLVVLFVVAAHPDASRKGSSPATVMAGARKRMATALRHYPAYSTDAPPARMGLVAWDQWFPASHCFSTQFLDGTVEILDSYTRTWSSTDLFLGMEFDPWPGFDATAVLTQVQAIGATPHWMRTLCSGDVLGLPSQRLGMPCPTASGSRQGIGVALNDTVGPTRPPARLHDPLGVGTRSRR
ncbi:hypothetical protein [Kocuria rosea]|uniref:Uncharacterized protein n=1 Tax=Kocuria rosea TaxID=1275 RepID=A0A4R5YCQ6_KOCRO|nr:hypothetical protein [Kocuria rosea]TDL42474.1 hypothetical protein E2R59_11045 [Kocuria rosea]